MSSETLAHLCEEYKTECKEILTDLIDAVKRFDKTVLLSHTLQVSGSKLGDSVEEYVHFVGGLDTKLNGLVTVLEVDTSDPLVLCDYLTQIARDLEDLATSERILKDEIMRLDTHKLFTQPVSTLELIDDRLIDVINDIEFAVEECKTRVEA